MPSTAVANVSAIKRDPRGSRPPSRHQLRHDSACDSQAVDITVALLVRWILEAASRGFDLRDLICVTAMTGDEHDRTRAMMERYLLPLLRKHSIRYVQIARRSQEASNGYEVLSDTRAPKRMYMRGSWRLSDEMRSAGTLPSLVKGRRWCSVDCTKSV